MKSPWKILSRALLGACLMSGVVSVNLLAADAQKPAPKAAAPHEAADLPNPKHDPKNPAEPNAGFVKRHEGFLKDLAAMNGKVGVLFVGDSITDGWRHDEKEVKDAKSGKEFVLGGKKVFDAAYGKLEPLNIGIGGDRTQHVLWRLDRGEVDGISPKVAVLMIGTNNLGGNTNEEIISGVTKIVEELNEKLPKTKVLLLAIFPRDAKPGTSNRTRIAAINEALAKLDDGGKTVKYLDIGPKFLDAEGNIPVEVMKDSLHPTTKGYRIWAEAMAPTLAEMMK